MATRTLTREELQEFEMTDISLHYRPNDPNRKKDNYNLTTEVKYCLYARKSSEDDERQALSIDSQISEMITVAKRNSLNVVEVIRESKSAKASWYRNWFNDLIHWINQWRFNWILAWAPDRLSRNAWDLWSLVDLMDKGCLKEIRTNWQVFNNAPNEKFLLMILCSQAKLENDNRSINVVRWLKTKAELGHLPHQAPLWYINERSYLRNWWRIAIDPVKAPYIKEIFEKVAYEWWSWRKIYKWLKEETNMRSRWWKIIPVSAIFKILNSTFYYWMYEYPKWSSNWCKWEYEPIITKELFDEAQNHMSIYPRYRPRNKNFEFTKLMKCWNCWSSITAQEKFKKILWQKRPKSYVYYHCSKYYNHKCKEPMIREDDLITQLLEMVDNIDIDTVMVTDSLKDEIRRYNLFQSQLLKKENHEMVSEKIIDLREYMKYLICNWSKDEKREILAMINANILIKNKKLLISKIQGNMVV